MQADTKHHWTFAAVDPDLEVVLHGHPSADAADMHYCLMRTWGGPRMIGMARRALTESAAVAAVKEAHPRAAVRVNYL